MKTTEIQEGDRLAWLYQGERLARMRAELALEEQNSQTFRMYFERKYTIHPKDVLRMDLSPPIIERAEAAPPASDGMAGPLADGGAEAAP